MLKLYRRCKYTELVLFLIFVLCGSTIRNYWTSPLDTAAPAIQELVLFRSSYTSCLYDTLSANFASLQTLWWKTRTSFDQCIMFSSVLGAISAIDAALDVKNINPNYPLYIPSRCMNGRCISNNAFLTKLKPGLLYYYGKKIDLIGRILVFRGIMAQICAWLNIGPDIHCCLAAFLFNISNIWNISKLYEPISLHIPINWSAIFTHILLTPNVNIRNSR